MERINKPTIILIVDYLIKLFRYLFVAYFSLIKLKINEGR